MSQYLNKFYNPRNQGSRQYYDRTNNPEIYRGYEIHNESFVQWNIVKDNICVGMNAGPNGAKRKIDQLILEQNGSNN